VASLLLSLFATIEVTRAEAYETTEIRTAMQYLMLSQYVDKNARDAYYDMPLSDLGDLIDAKLNKVNKCYEESNECFEDSKSYNNIRSIYFNRLGETGPQMAVFFDQLTDAYFMCYEEEEEPELCEHLHEMQNSIYEWAAPKYAADIQTYGWLIDEMLEGESEEPIYNEPTANELIQYALEKINQDRTKFDLPPVLLSANQAA
jgi:hypothetical protein